MIEPGPPLTTLRRTLRFRDLLLYGIVLVQPTGPMPVFGVIHEQARGHVTTAILLALCAMLPTAVSYGYMSRAYPGGGSAFTYVGRELHPMLGYLTGWSMLMDYLLNPLICTIWCSKAAVNFLPGTPLFLWIALFAALFTALNLLGIETSARLNLLLTIALTLVIVVLLAAFTHYLHAHLPSAPDLLLPLYNRASFSSAAVLRGTSIAVLTYIGFDGISTLADEAREPARDIPRAIVGTCLFTGVLAVLLVYLAQLVWPAGQSFPDLDTAYVFVAERAGGHAMFLLLNGALLVATIGSGMASHLGAARLLFSMGQQGALPRRFFAAVHPVSRIPRNNVLLVGGIILVGALLLSYQTGAELLNYGALLAFIGVNLASVVRSWRLPEKNPTAIALGLAGAVVCAALWCNLGHLALAAGSAWALSGLLLYAWSRSRRASLTTV